MHNLLAALVGFSLPWPCQIKAQDIGGNCGMGDGDTSANESIYR
jgi:hypothetical protein